MQLIDFGHLRRMSSDRTEGPLAPLCRKLGIHHPTFAVCITQFGACLIGTVFSFYYVKVFLNKFEISSGWFQVAQVLFMVWNAINDPLFGYFQDIGSSWMRSRKKSILYGAPFFALSFLLPWFPWASAGSPSWVTGLHLIVALFFYDGFFSFVLLAYCALFTEIATDHASRVRIIKYMQIATLIGVNVITIMEKLSNSLQDFGSFQMATVLIAFVALCCWTYTGLYAPSKIAQVQSFKHLIDEETGESAQVDKENKSTFREGLALTKQVFSARDFWAITLANFFHTCRSTAHLNFAAIFTEALIPRSILPLGSWQLSAFYGASTLIPQILVISSSKLMVKFGPYRLLMFSFVTTVVSGSAAYFLAANHPYLIMLFMLIDSVAVHSFSPLINILFADFVDDDMVRNSRRTPLSSLIFSLNALIVKPAQSLAPMLVVFILNQYGYESYRAVFSTDRAKTAQDLSQNTDGIIPENGNNVMAAGQFADLRNSMFTILCLLPVLWALIEYAVFRRYTLKNKHLNESQSSEDLEKLIIASGTAL